MLLAASATPLASHYSSSHERVIRYCYNGGSVILLPAIVILCQSLVHAGLQQWLMSAATLCGGGGGHHLPPSPPSAYLRIITQLLFVMVIRKTTFTPLPLVISIRANIIIPATGESLSPRSRWWWSGEMPPLSSGHIVYHAAPQWWRRSRVGHYATKHHFLHVRELAFMPRIILSPYAICGEFMSPLNINTPYHCIHFHRHHHAHHCHFSSSPVTTSPVLFVSPL